MKKVLILIGLIILISAKYTSANYRVLVFLPNNYGANYFLNLSNFERFGWEITIAGCSRHLNPCPMYASVPPLNCPVVTADTLVNEIQSIAEWDCIAVMSGSRWAGNACGDILVNQHALNLVKNAADSGLMVVGFCTGVRVLAAADVIDGLQITGNGYPPYVAEYQAAGGIWLGKNIPPVIQGNIITCAAGDFFNIHNCAAIIQAEVRMAQVGKQGKAKAKQKNILKSEYQYAEGAWAVVATPDGGCITAGYSYKNTTESDIYLAYFNQSNEIVIENQLQIAGWQFATSIASMANNEYIVSGFASDSSGSIDAILLKIDANLNVLWMKYYGGDSYDIANNACVLSDGSIAVAGYTESQGAGQDDAWIFKTDNQGNMQWEITKGTVNSEMAFGIIQSTDNCLIAAGNRGTFINEEGQRDAMLIKLNMDGVMLWQKFYSTFFPGPGRHSEWGIDVCETPDGGFFLAGHHDRVYKELKNGRLIKTDASGNELWRASIGEGTFYDGLNTVIATDSCIYLSGFTTSETTGEKGYFIQCHNWGDSLKREIYGGNSHAAFYDMTKHDDYFIAAGQVLTADSSFNVRVKKLYGKAVLSIANNKALSNLTSVYPNPFHNLISIICKYPDKSIIEYKLYSNSGTLLDTKCFETSGLLKTQFNYDSIPPENYIMEIKIFNQIKTKLLNCERFLVIKK